MALDTALFSESSWYHLVACCIQHSLVWLT